MRSPVLAFADYMRDFLLDMDTSKEALGVVVFQKQGDGHYHPVAYGSQALTAHEKNSLHQIGVPGIKMGHHGTF